jgi:uncharacterized DUF497 family protein
MRIIPDPAKEAVNVRKHKLDFASVEEVLTGETVDYWDDRPLGYEHEGRVRLLGRLGQQVVVLVFEPVEGDGSEFGVRPVSLRRATRREAGDYWKVCGR